MDASQILDPREFSLYKTTASAIKEVLELQSDDEPQSIASIRIMHSVSIKSMQGIERFIGLIELNLSSNSIERIENLHNLTNLQVLNLSCNRIRVINCLETLKNLQKLILASNRISSLQSLNQLAGDDYSLRTIDLKDNKITNLAELTHLNNLTKLQELSLSMEDEINPAFRDTNKYVAALFKLSIAFNLQKIDGKPANVFFSALDHLPEKQRSKVQDEEDYYNNDEDERGSQTNRKNEFNTAPRKQSSQSPPQTHKRDIRPHVANNYAEDNITSKAQQQEIFTLQQKFQKLLEDHKELLYKFDANDKFWTNKTQKLEDELLELSQENKAYQDKNARLYNSLNAKNQELDDLSNTIAALKAKKDRKEEMIDSLQSKMGDIMKENGECHKEITLRVEEISHLKQNLSDADARINELKAVIRENEKNLTEIHTKAIENSNLNLLRSEDLQRKYEGLHRTYEEKCKESQHLAEKNRELVDLVRDWESKFNSKIQTSDHQKNEEIGVIENEYRKKFDDVNEKHQKELLKQEENFKESMDLLENEFKKVLLENNSRYKQLRIAFEEKCKSENDLKEFMKITIAKSTEQEKLIEEQNDVLRRLRNEYVNNLQEKDELSRLLSDKNSTIKNSVNTYREDFERAQKEKETTHRVMKDLEDDLATKTRELAALRRRIIELEAQYEDQERLNERMKEKLKERENRTNNEIEKHLHENEDLKELINTKNRMLDDQNVRIDELKSELDHVKKQLEGNQAEKELEQVEKELERERRETEKLRQEFDHHEEYIAKLKGKITSLREDSDEKAKEIDELRQELAEKSDIVEQLERGVNEVIIKQREETVKQRDKDKRIGELEALIEECRSTIVKKGDRVRSLEELIRQKDLDLEKRDGDIEKIIKAKDREVDSLRRKNQRNEEDMKVLVLEIERQKSLAKENIEKLHQIFK